MGVGAFCARFEDEGMAEKVELDAVNVVLRDGLFDQGEAEVAHGLVGVVEGDRADAREGVVLADQPLGMVEFHPADVTADIQLVEFPVLEHGIAQRGFRAKKRFPVALDDAPVVGVVHPERQQEVEPALMGGCGENPRRIVAFGDHRFDAIGHNLPAAGVEGTVAFVEALSDIGPVAVEVGGASRPLDIGHGPDVGAERPRESVDLGMLEITERGIDEALGREGRGGCGCEGTEERAAVVVEDESVGFFAHYIPRALLKRKGMGQKQYRPP